MIYWLLFYICAKKTVFIPPHPTTLTMNLLRHTILLAVLFFGAASLFAQSDRDYSPREIVFPDIPGYYTLSADLHTHTVFSDGRVWPNIRVQEALLDKLDAIAITDHLEHQPNRGDIPHPDRNRPYEIAKRAASGTDLIVINGAEVTRSMPPGHLNAVFLTDVNELLVDDPVTALRRAKAQDAFIFWNHPSWSRQASDGIARLDPMHISLIEEGLIHGIEIVNHYRVSREAIQIALDHNLAMVCNTDVHGLIDWDWVSEGMHRPSTLIFAESPTEDGLKEALLAGRTVVADNNLLIGRDEFLVPLIQNSLTIEQTGYERNNTSVLDVYIQNHSIHKFILRNVSEYSMHRTSDIITLKPHAITKITVNLPEQMDEIRLPFEVLSALNGPETHPLIVLEQAIAN